MIDAPSAESGNTAKTTAPHTTVSPAITEVAFVGSDGYEQLRISRVAIDTVASHVDYAGNPVFSAPVAGRPYFGPVHFRESILEQKVLPTLIGRFVESVLGGSAEPLVAYLAGSEKLSAKDLETLRGICRKIAKEPEKP